MRNSVDGISLIEPRGREIGEIGPWSVVSLRRPSHAPAHGLTDPIRTDVVNGLQEATKGEIPCSDPLCSACPNWIDSVTSQIKGRLRDYLTLGFLSQDPGVAAFAEMLHEKLELRRIS